MRALDIQVVNVQTPGVERAHQIRPQQMEAEQRQFQNIVLDSQDEKMAQAQQAPDTREARFQIRQEQERKQSRSQKEREQREEEPDEEPRARPRGRNLNTGRTIDIIV